MLLWSSWFFLISLPLQKHMKYDAIQRPFCNDLIYIYDWCAEQRQTTLNEAQQYITSEH